MNNETNIKQNAETHIYRANGRRIDRNGKNTAFQRVLNKYKTNKIAFTSTAHPKVVQLADLQTAIYKYSAETMKPRTAVSNRKTATANLAALFKETDDILKTKWTN